MQPIGGINCCDACRKRVVAFWVSSIGQLASSLIYKELKRRCIWNGDALHHLCEPLNSHIHRVKQNFHFQFKKSLAKVDVLMLLQKLLPRGSTTASNNFCKMGLLVFFFFSIKARPMSRHAFICAQMLTSVLFFSEGFGFTNICLF